MVLHDVSLRVSILVVIVARTIAKHTRHISSLSVFVMVLVFMMVSGSPTKDVSSKL